MEDIKVIDLSMDDREFRNYVNTMLRKHGYVRFYMDDSRVSDEEFDNNNDIKVSKMVCDMMFKHILILK